MIVSLKFDCPDLGATQTAGAQIAERLVWPGCVYLLGEMGAGKTTLCQSIIAALGYTGTVTSPTYNLVHQYPVAAGLIHHIDLYRLQSSQEMEFLGLADMLEQDSLLLIEWPSQAQGQLPKATQQVEILIGADGQSRQIELQTN